MSMPREAVRPLIRGLAVLRALAASGGRRQVSELVRDTGLARSAVDRVVGTLAHVGYLRLEGRDAVTTPRLMELGNAYLAACGLPDLLGPLAECLADALDESVSLAVPDGDGVRFVHQSTRRRAMSVTFRLGDLLPAERLAAGAVFATDWSSGDWARWRAGSPGPGADTFEARTAAAEHGLAVDDQLIEPGLIAIAAPVRDAAGAVVCAVSVVSHTSRHSAASLREAVQERVGETVAAMEAALKAPPPPRAAARRQPVASAKRELGAAFNESLARGLAVLAALDRPSTLSGAAAVTGLAPATVRRALITLEHLGYLRVDGRTFQPTPRVLELYVPGLTLARICQPHLAALVARVHESASAAILSGAEIQYIARVPTVRIMSVNVTIGTRFPAYATAMGRALLAGLPPDSRAALLAVTPLEPLTRRTVTSPERLAAILDLVALDGFALVDGELEEGLRSIAVPVRERCGRVVAAVNVAMHAERDPSQLESLRDTAAAIEADLHVAGRYTAIPVG